MRLSYPLVDSNTIAAWPNTPTEILLIAWSYFAVQNVPNSGWKKGFFLSPAAGKDPPQLLPGDAGQTVARLAMAKVDPSPGVSVDFSKAHRISRSDAGRRPLWCRRPSPAPEQPESVMTGQNHGGHVRGKTIRNSESITMTTTRIPFRIKASTLCFWILPGVRQGIAAVLLGAALIHLALGSRVALPHSPLYGRRRMFVSVATCRCSAAGSIEC
jgi:hypothetical protein